MCGKMVAKTGCVEPYLPSEADKAVEPSARLTALTAFMCVRRTKAPDSHHGHHSCVIPAHRLRTHFGSSVGGPDGNGVLSCPRPQAEMSAQRAILQAMLGSCDSLCTSAPDHMHAFHRGRLKCSAFGTPTSLSPPK